MRLVRFVWVFFFSISSTVCASVAPENERWHIQGEYLYLLPSISQTAYAIQKVAPFLPIPAGERFTNDPDFQSAYRIEGIYNFCNCWSDFRFQWTHLPKFHQTDSVARSAGARGLLMAIQGYPLSQIGAFFFTNASSKISFEYHAVDALAGFYGIQNRTFRTLLQLGLQYANFCFEEDLTYTSTDPVSFLSLVHLKNSSDLWGIGPELGFKVDYGIPYCQTLFHIPSALSLVAKARGALLVSHYNNVRFDYDTLGTPGLQLVNVKNPSRWDVIPFWDIRIGLNYALTFECLCTHLEVGYEMFSYRNVISRIQFPFITPLNFTLESNVSFQGPYAALGCSF